MTPGVLVVWSGHAPCLQVFPLGPDGFVIGRETLDATTDDRISRQHARVAYADGRFVVKDLGSRNGTYAGGHALVEREVTVTPPSIVRTGRTVSVLTADVTPFLGGSIETRGGLVLGPISHGAIARVTELATRPRPVAITGEPSSGRTSIAKTYLDALGGGSVFDPRIQLVPIAKLRLPLLVIGLERLPQPDVEHLEATLDRFPNTLIAATAPRGMAGVVPSLARRFEVIELPPVRDRFDELSGIVERAVRAKQPELGIHSTLLEACLLRPWPGNIRELVSAVQSAADQGAAAKHANVRGEDLDNDDGYLVVNGAYCVYPGMPAHLRGGRPR